MPATPQDGTPPEDASMLSLSALGDLAALVRRVQVAQQGSGTSSAM
jgi:hypothetical protein